MNEELAKKAYFKNYQGLPMPEWENLPEGIQKAWVNAASAIASPEKKPAERCYWIVEAGVSPGKPDPTFTTRFAMNSAEYEAEDGQEKFLFQMVKALEYARSLHEPQRLSWVNFQWIWC